MKDKGMDIRRILMAGGASEFRGPFVEQGYGVADFRTGPDALDWIEANGLPHVALLDVNLPGGMGGFELSKRIRDRGDVPVIFISEVDDAEIVTEALRLYADDYVIRPAHIPELVARVDRVLSRVGGFDFAGTVRIDEGLSVAFGKGELYANGETYALTPTEAQILHILMRGEGEPVENRMFLERIWPEGDGNMDTLRIHMHRLRRKVEPDGEPRYILTERGVGYRFAMPQESIKA